MGYLAGPLHRKGWLWVLNPLAAAVDDWQQSPPALSPSGSVTTGTGAAPRAEQLVPAASSDVTAAAARGASGQQAVCPPVPDTLVARLQAAAGTFAATSEAAAAAAAEAAAVQAATTVLGWVGSTHAAATAERRSLRTALVQQADAFAAERATLSAAAADAAAQLDAARQQLATAQAAPRPRVGAGGPALPDGTAVTFVAGSAARSGVGRGCRGTRAAAAGAAVARAGRPPPSPRIGHPPCLSSPPLAALQSWGASAMPAAPLHQAPRPSPREPGSRMPCAPAGEGGAAAWMAKRDAVWSVDGRETRPVF